MECTYTEWRCLYFKQCVSLWKRCDGIKDCGDFTDEQGCGALTSISVSLSLGIIRFTDC